MTRNFLSILKLPFWGIATISGAKNFSANRILGSQRLNRLGLHRLRVLIAARMTNVRRRRLAKFLHAEEIKEFEENGFILIEDFLPITEFEDLKSQVAGFKGPVREMHQGGTITRRASLGPKTLKSLPQVASLLRRSDWLRKMQYVASFQNQPLFYLQAIISDPQGDEDPQMRLHADAFHSSLKAWFFLTDVAEDAMPFTYVPGSHRLTEERLNWEYEKSLKVLAEDNKYSARGSFRISAEELPKLGLPEPQRFAVSRNTLLIADTFGFHARGACARPSQRLEIWTYLRRNPFLPWTGLDLLSMPIIADHRVPIYWWVRDMLEKLGVKGNSWRASGEKYMLDTENRN